MKNRCHPSFFVLLLCVGIIIGAVLVCLCGPKEISDGKKANIKNDTDAISFSKNWLTDRIYSSLPEEDANLGVAYLLGEKDGLSDQFKEYLQAAGLSHVVVASGAHLSIIVGFVRKIFGRISRKAGVVFALIFVLIFMALIGWTPSILRAGIMTILTLLSWYNGRKFQPYKLILITAAITLLINPSFVSDLGWQLSFASYSGIMLLGPSVISYFYGEKKPGFVGSMVITTISATLLVAPISLYYFGSLSLIALAANILILPTLSIVMGLTFTTGIFAGVPIIGLVVSWASEQLLNLHQIIIEFLGTKNYFLITIPKQNPAVFLLYFVILFPFGVSFFRNRRKVSKKSIEHSFVIPSREKDNIGTRGWTIPRKNAKISKI